MVQTQIKSWKSFEKCSHNFTFIYQPLLSHPLTKSVLLVKLLFPTHLKQYNIFTIMSLLVFILIKLLYNSLIADGSGGQSGQYWSI